MVILPPGRFRQGSPNRERGRAANEGPIREVSIGKVALGQREVTRGEFRQFVNATGYRTEAERGVPSGWSPTHKGCMAYLYGPYFDQLPDKDWRDPGFSQDDDHPVVCVSWNDAQAYVEWLRQETGNAYRLPSESEQEYAIRAGTTSPWPWGKSGHDGCQMVNYGDASLHARFPQDWYPTERCQDGHTFTAPAGTFAANVFGLHEISGNVREFSQDCWNDSYAGAPTDGSAWQSGDCYFRVARGGSWYTPAPGLRSALRNRVTLPERDMFHGFRLAITLCTMPRVEPMSC